MSLNSSVSEIKIRERCTLVPSLWQPTVGCYFSCFCLLLGNNFFNVFLVKLIVTAVLRILELYVILLQACVYVENLASLAIRCYSLGITEQMYEENYTVVHSHAAGENKLHVMYKKKT